MKIRFFRLHFTCGALFFLASGCFIVSCNNDGKVEPSKPDSLASPTTRAANVDTVNCTQIASLAKEYRESLLARAESRKNFYLKEAPIRFKDKLINDWKERPIAEAVANIYMTSYRRSVSASNTRSVIISLRELAFYVDYLQRNHLDSIQFSFARFDVDALRADQLTHPDLEGNVASRNTKYTLITGLPIPKTSRTGSRYAQPFNIDGVLMYDDWHEIWP